VSDGGGRFDFVDVSAGSASSRHHVGQTVGMALGGQHGPSAGIGGRCLGATVGPCLQIVQRIDDAAAELSIGRTGAVGPVLFQRAAREAKESRGFGRAQVARRQAGVWIGHIRGSVVSWSATAIRGASVVTMAEEASAGGCR
jgi:hypothetical protein